MKFSESKKIITKIVILLIVALIEPIGTMIHHKKVAFYYNNFVMKYGPSNNIE